MSFKPAKGRLYNSIYETLSFIGPAGGCDVPHLPLQLPNLQLRQ